MAKQTFTTGQVLTAAQMTSLQQTAMGGGSPSTKTASYVLVAADAGTVIQMNSASSTTITVNTSLFAAGDSVQIQNIGAGVCTITAGTATVNTAGSLALSQWEGGFLYFTSASSAIFFDVVQSSGMTNPMTTNGDTIYGGASGTPTRLAIGSTGQVLTVSSGIPSWATPASSGGMTLISTTSLSGASTTISSIPGTYKNLQLVIRDLLPATDTAGLNMRLNGDSTANRYTVSAWGQATNTALAFDDTQLGGIVQLIDNAVTKNLTIVNFYDYTNTTTYRYGTVQGVSVNGTDSTKITTGAYHLYYNQTNAITSITLLMSSGNITSGSALLYGVS